MTKLDLTAIKERLKLMGNNEYTDVWATVETLIDEVERLREHIHYLEQERLCPK